MPRKKAADVSGQVNRIHCPACACLVSSDGQKLYETSAKYLESLKTSEVLGTLEGKFKELETLLENSEKELAAAVSAKQNLESQLKEANARSEKASVETLEPKQTGKPGKPAGREEDDW